MYNHTMNGIITISDGMGTIIENNSIITGDISSNNITKMLGNISLLETKTTNQSFSGSTTSFTGGLQVLGNVLIQGNTIQYGRIDANILSDGMGTVIKNNTIVTGDISSNNITAILGNISILQTKTTNQSFSGTTTSFTGGLQVSGNVLIRGQIDVSNVAISGYTACAESLAVGGDLAVSNNIVSSGSIITGKNIQCATLSTQNLVVNNAVIQSDTQAQIDYIFEILARNQLT